MNHLHHVIEQEQMAVTELLKGRVDADVVSSLRGVALRAQCFDMGECDPWFDFKLIPELVRLPYPVCWFESRMKHPQDGFTFVGSLLMEVDETISGTVFSKWAARPWCIDILWSINAEQMRSGERAPLYVEPTIPGTNNGVAALAHITLAFLGALNCANVGRIEQRPSRELQKARQRRGKMPLFSTWTLKLNLSRDGHHGDAGGTHASPRLHLRRGHARQFAPGRYCWVQPHMVGNAELGVIEKDYAVEAHA